MRELFFALLAGLTVFFFNIADAAQTDCTSNPTCEAYLRPAPQNLGPCKPGMIPVRFLQPGKKGQVVATIKADGKPPEAFPSRMTTERGGFCFGEGRLKGASLEICGDKTRILTKEAIAQVLALPVGDPGRKFGVCLDTNETCERWRKTNLK